MSDIENDGKYYLKINLPGLPPGGNARATWRAKYKNTVKWKTKVKNAVIKQGAPKKPLKKVRLKYLRASCKQMDWDNLVICFKPVQDGLVEAGVILDDTCEQIPEMPIYEQKKLSTRKGYISIEVFEI